MYLKWITPKIIPSYNVSIIIIYSIKVYTRYIDSKQFLI